MKVNEKRLKAMIMDAHAHEGRITCDWVDRYLAELEKRGEVLYMEKPWYAKEFAKWVIVHEE